MHFGINVCKFEEHWSLQLFRWFIPLPFKVRKEPEELLDKWGWDVDFGERYFKINFGEKYWFWYFPWMLDHCRTEVMLEGGVFVSYERFPPRRQLPEGIYEAPEPPNRYRAVLPFSYKLESGEIQERTATVTVERLQWCWRSWPFRWWRWPNATRTAINIEFSDEVGEESGSWKGGVIGCGYDLRPNETPVESFERMMRERKF